MTSAPQPGPLTDAATEIERHVGTRGWDQPTRLFALARTQQLLEAEPALAQQLGIEPGADTPGGYTPVEQELGEKSLEELLPTITWPDSVVGCAVCVERIVLPPGSENDMPDEPDAAGAWADQHPERSDVRLVVAVEREGASTAVLRIRGHEEASDLLRDDEMAPELAEALIATFN